MPDKIAIITAGGGGTRIATSIPKQFLLLQNKPVLYHSLLKFFEADKEIKLVVTLPSQHIEYWKRICIEHQINIPHDIVEGGETRFHSIQNGLFSINNNVDGFIAIHDAARPFVTPALINTAFAQAEQKNSAIPAIPLTDSVRMYDNNNWHAVDRDNFRVIQTPQVFNLSLLREAYKTDFRKTFTDDASVYENAGHAVHIYKGDSYNIKITTAADLDYAKYLIQMADNK